MSDNNKEMEAFSDQTITLTLEDDTEVECAVIAIFPVDDNQYMALLPVEEVGDISTDEVFIYRYTPSDDDSDDVNLETIESDEEYDKVADAFDELLAEEDFDDDGEIIE